MKVLVACEESQTACLAFRSRGHEAYSNDIIECSGGHPEWHLQMDALEAIKLMDWDMMIAHPPCTRLCNSGVSWLAKRNLWEEMERAAKFFKQLLDTDIPRVAVENPIPHKYALQIIGRKYDQLIQPWMFGHPETKATCLWLKNLPPLMPTDLRFGREQRLHRLPPSPDRAKPRSKTFQGIADAFAEQYGRIITKENAA